MPKMTDNLKQLRIFLCHSSGDKQAVRDLYERLRAEGFDPWLDEEKLFPGDDWRQKIPAAVRAADIVIVCLSRGSINKRGYVQKEIKYALDVADEQPENTIYLIPLKLEECDIPERLRRWHCVNLFEQKGYARLINALRHRTESIGTHSLSMPETRLDSSGFEIFLESETEQPEEIKKTQSRGEEYARKEALEVKSRYIEGAILTPELEIKSDEKNAEIEKLAPSSAKDDKQPKKITKTILIAIAAGIIGTIILISIIIWQPPQSLQQQPPISTSSNSPDAETYLNQGRECNERKDYDCAINYYNRAIELNPQYVDAYYYRGISYDDKEAYNAAIGDYTRAIELNPQYAEAYFNRGVAHDNNRNYDEAIKDYTRAIELKPRFIIAFTNRGGAYAGKEDFDAAIKDYTKAIEMNPQYAEAFYNRGSVYDDKGNYDAAIKDYTKAIELKPDFVSAYVNRGVAYDNIGNYNKAIKDYTKAITLNPQEAMAYDNRSIDYERIGEKAKAQADRQKYEELSKKK